MSELREEIQEAFSRWHREEWDAVEVEQAVMERVGKMLGVIEAAREIAKWRHDTQELDAALAALDTQDTEQGKGAGERQVDTCDECAAQNVGPCPHVPEQNTDEQGDSDG